ncbi:MAG: single-stranded-DNA-specific exonuclease RecJ [Planctomycetota bacterium]|jgi:single-stranded-DNA-specific exonuclease
MTEVNLPEITQTLIDGLGLDPVLAALLAKRGVHTVAAARTFLHPSLDALPDPLGLPDMEAAVERVVRAIRDKESIIAHGDYDADGTSGAALLTRVLGTAGADIRGVIPDRQRHGYGLSRELCAAAADAGATLLITTDVGSADAQVVADITAMGFDVVITDHHEMAAVLPEAVAIVNPRRAPGGPGDGMCGAAIAFLLASAVVQRLGPGAQRKCQYALREGLELAALASVADVAVLRGASRALVAHGLKLLKEPHNPGLAALKLRAKIGVRTPTTTDLSYQLIPRINAMGRVDDATLALDLLTTRDPGDAGRLAQLCDKANRRRQRIQREVRADADQQVEVRPEAPAFVLSGEGWHAGVVGVVAGQLCQQWRRPVAVIAVDSKRGKATGSSRSVAGAPLPAILDACDDLLLAHGGHARAAGFSLEPRNIGAFRERFEAEVAKCRLGDDGPPPTEIDLPLAALTPAATEAMHRLAPFGEGNPAPVVGVRSATVVGEIAMPKGRGAFALRRFHLRDGEAVLEVYTRGERAAVTRGDVVRAVLRWNHRPPHWELLAAVPPEASP